MKQIYQLIFKKYSQYIIAADIVNYFVRIDYIAYAKVMHFDMLCTVVLLY